VAHPERVKDIIAYVIRKGAAQGAWLRVNAHPIDPENEFGLDGIVISLKDISENKRQGETLEAIFENFPGGIAYHDAQTRMVACNETYREMFGIPEEMVAQKLTRREYMLYGARRGDYGEGNPEDLVNGRLELINNTDATRNLRKTPDGRYIETRTTPLPDGGMVFGFIDVTESTHREQAIRNSETVQRTTLEALSEGVVVLSDDGVVQSANPAVQTLFGIGEEDLLGKPLSDAGLKIECQIDGFDEPQNPLTMAVKDPLSVRGVISKLASRTGGQETWLRLNARPVEVEDDFGINGVVISITDITEAKQHADTLQTIFDNFPGGVAHYDENFQLASYNADYAELLGYPADFVEQKLHLLDYLRFTAEQGDFGEGDPEQLAREKFGTLKTCPQITWEGRLANGKYIETHSTPLPTGGTIHNFFDVTKRRKMERELAKSEKSARHRLIELETVLSNMRQGVSVFDEKGRITLWNQQYIDIFRKPDGEVAKGRTITELIRAEKDRGDFDGNVDEHVFDLMTRLNSGEIVRSKFAQSNGRIVSVIQTPLPGGGWIGTHEDITSREQAAAKIAYAAHHDSLTGLANRTLFNATLNETLSNARIHGQNASLLLMDLDKFKPVNDTFGHVVGDELLKQVAVRLKDCVRSSDLVSRLGGDEFALILPGTSINSHGTAEIASRIVEGIRKPFKVYSETIEIGISVGIAPITAGDSDTSTIIKKADIALYEVKHQGRNNFRFFDESSKHCPIKPFRKVSGSAA
jgi:diguanylate cyclase (GGDEF)-like protein/PAS domain S-box-containing protein